MTEGYLDTQGIYYRVTPIDPNKTTLVFIHGIWESSSAYKPFEKKLQETYNLVLFDLRGHGYSKYYTRAEEYTLEGFAGDIVALMTHLEIKKPTLVAYSFGALIALQAEKMLPNFSKQIILLAPAYKLYSLFRVRVFIVFMTALSYILLALPFYSKRGFHTDFSLYTPAGERDPRRMLVDIKNTGPHIYVWSFLTMTRFRGDAWWQEVKAPKYLIHGTKDGVVPLSISERFRKEVPGAELLVLQGANHMLPLNNVTDIVAHIRAKIQ